jgi:hypothetical protein
MLRRRSTKQNKRRHNRNYERIRLELHSPSHGITPYQYIRPSTVPLGIEPPIPTQYDINRSTIRVYKTSSDSDNTRTNYDKDTSDDDSSISEYTIRLYNRLEGRWEDRCPSAFHQPQKYQKFQEKEEARLSDEPHPVHSTEERPYYIEYHRLRKYTIDTDSSFIPSSSTTSSDTTSNNDYSTVSEEALNSEYTSQFFEGSNPNYFPDWERYKNNLPSSTAFEFDSDGDFPFQGYSSSSTTSTSLSQSLTTGYATQEEYNDPNHHLTFDRTLNPITGRHNQYYWQHLNDTHQALTGTYLPKSTKAPLEYRPPSSRINTNNTNDTSSNSSDDEYYAKLGRSIYLQLHPSSDDDNEVYSSYDSSYEEDNPKVQSINNNNTVPETRITSTTTHVTTTETGTPTTNPLPTLGSRYNLPLRAARKSTHPVYAVPRTNLLSASKQTARKSTVTQEVHTVHRTVAVAPDTTTSAVHPTKNLKRNWKKEPSDSDSSDIPYMPRFKRDPNA